MQTIIMCVTLMGAAAAGTISMVRYLNAALGRVHDRIDDAHKTAMDNHDQIELRVQRSYDRLADQLNGVRQDLSGRVHVLEQTIAMHLDGHPEHRSQPPEREHG